MKKEKSKTQINAIASFFKFSAIVMSKVGTIGFVVIAIICYIFYFVPQNLKDELTNTWLLFKCKECQNIYILLLIVVAILFLLQNYFYRKAIRLKDNRIKEMGKEKTELQEKLLNKTLQSSK